MGQFNNSSLTVPESFARAIASWRGVAFAAVIARVEKNMTGPMLNRRTGATLANVRSNSGLIPLGFQLKTTNPALIARLKGSPRKGFFVAPVKASALSWISGGTRVFSKGHFIPPWKFPQLEIFDDSISQESATITKLLETRIIKATSDLFPSVRLRFQV